MSKKKFALSAAGAAAACFILSSCGSDVPIATSPTFTVREYENPTPEQQILIDTIKQEISDNPQRLFIDGNANLTTIFDVAVALGYTFPGVSTPQSALDFANELLGQSVTLEMLRIVPTPELICGFTQSSTPEPSIKDVGVLLARTFPSLDTSEEIASFVNDLLGPGTINASEILYPSGLPIPCSSNAPSPSPNPSNNTFEFKDGVILIEEGDVELVSQDDSTITFSGALPAINPGDIIVSTLGVGALREVISVSQQGGGQTVLVTQQAKLVDAFEELEFSVNTSVEPDFSGDLFSEVPGLEIDFVTPSNIRNLPRRQLSILESQIRLNFANFLFGNQSASITLTGDTLLKNSISLNLSLENELIEINGSSEISNSLVLNATAGGSLSRNYNEVYALRCTVPRARFIPLDRCLLPYIIRVPGVPVIILPVLELDLGVTGAAAGSFSSSLTNSLGFTGSIFAGINGVGSSFSPLTDFQTTFSDVEASLSAELNSSVSTRFLLYGLAGPAIGLRTEIEAEGETAERDNEEGILVEVEAKGTAPYGFGGSRLFEELFGVVDFSSLAGKFTLFEEDIYEEFFPFKGQGSIVVADNGTGRDDVFVVSIDDVVLGQTTKGGSGQFRITEAAIQPGERSLKIECIVDDLDPPCTYGITLANGVTFTDGSTQKSGTIELGTSITFSVIVPPADPENSSQQRLQSVHPPMPVNSVLEE